MKNSQLKNPSICYMVHESGGTSLVKVVWDSKVQQNWVAREVAWGRILTLDQLKREDGFCKIDVIFARGK